MVPAISSTSHSRAACRPLSTWVYENFTFEVVTYCSIYCSEFAVNVLTARCYASAVLAMALCRSVRPSVCLSVCPSQVGVLLKRLNVGSHKQHHTIVQGILVFRSQRSPRNSTGVTPYEGAECRWGGSKSATFDIYPAISRKRYIVSIKVE